MEYVALVFGIFGLLAYMQVSSLKRRVDLLEDQLARTEGTAAYEERNALLDAVQRKKKKKVVIEFKEDEGDVDVVMYGNTKHGSNTILDADGEWVLVKVDSVKWTKEKLIRLSSIARISVSPLS